MDIDKTEKFWDRLAKGFDKNSKHFQQPPIHRALRYLNDKDVVLDFGCATGNEAIEIAGIVGEVRGIDISSKMIAIAKEKAEKADLKNVYFEQSSLFDKNHKVASFNVVLSCNILHLFDDTQSVLQRMNELLRPKGLIIVVTSCVGESGVLNKLQRLLFVTLMKLGSIPAMKFFKTSDLRVAITNANFQIIEFERINSSSNYFIVAEKVVH